jgi:hypothetical protein
MTVNAKLVFFLRYFAVTLIYGLFYIIGGIVGYSRRQVNFKMIDSLVSDPNLKMVTEYVLPWPKCSMWFAVNYLRFATCSRLLSRGLHRSYLYNDSLR